MKTDFTSGYRELHRVHRYDLRRLSESVFYVRADYWKSQVDVLPNPPLPLDREHQGAEMVWYERRTDMLLLHFPGALLNTGHSGRYDNGELEEAYFDTHGFMDRCLFVPSDAIDFVRMNVSREDVADMAIRFGRLSGGNYSVHQFSPRPLICNLAQYGFSQSRVAEMYGVSRQAVHKMLLSLPLGVRELMTGAKYQPQAQVCGIEGCNTVTRTDHNRQPMTFCPDHMAEFNIAGFSDSKFRASQIRDRVRTSGVSYSRQSVAEQSVFKQSEAETLELLFGQEVSSGKDQV